MQCALLDSLLRLLLSSLYWQVIMYRAPDKALETRLFIDRSVDQIKLGLIWEYLRLLLEQVGGKKLPQISTQLFILDGNSCEVQGLKAE